MYMHSNHCHQVTAHLQSNVLLSSPSSYLMSPMKIIDSHHRMTLLLDSGCTTNLSVLRFPWHLFIWWSAFGFLHHMICFFCRGVSEEYIAFFFRVTELVHVDAAVITSGAQFVKLFVGQFCPVPCYFLLLCPT